MRISPHDIRQQQFTVRMFRGFDPQEVDAFLEDVAEDYETLLKEVQGLREQITVNEERHRGLADRERALQDALMTTQRLADEMKAVATREAEDIRSSAQREADLILREAEMRAEKNLEAGRAEEAWLRNEIHQLKRMRRQAFEEMTSTLERYRRLLAGEQEGEADEPAY